MIVDSFDYIACYKGLHPNLDKAIDWLNSRHALDALENGKTIIDGENVFVNVMDADLRVPRRGRCVRVPPPLCRPADRPDRQ